MQYFTLSIITICLLCLLDLLLLNHMDGHGAFIGIRRDRGHGIPKLKWNCVTIFVINCFPQLDQHRHALLGLEVHAFSIPNIAWTGRGRGLEVSAQPM